MESDRPYSRAGARPSELLFVLSGLALLLAVEVTVVSPVGEFPIDDDWAFARIARHWAETGRFEYVGWNQMMVVTQAALGALVIKLFGFSFTGLRCLTLALGIVSLVALYGCAREMGLAPCVAVPVMLTVAVSPLFLSSAYTFMTEIPFLALYLGALWAFLRFFRTESRGVLVAAALLTLAAFLQRQPALLLLVAALAHACARCSTPRQRRDLWRTVLALAPAMGLALLWRTTQPDHDEATTLWSAALALGPTGVLDGMATVPFRLFCAFQYLGLYGLPLVAALAVPALAAVRRHPRRAMGSAAAMVVLTATTYVTPLSITHIGRSMPYLCDVLKEYPPDADGSTLRGQGPRLLGRGSRLALTAAALVGSTLFLLVALSMAADLRRRSAVTAVARRPAAEKAAPGCERSRPGIATATGFVYVQWLLQLLFISAVSLVVWERYYLVLLPPGLLLVAGVLTAPLTEREAPAEAPRRAHEPDTPPGADTLAAPHRRFGLRPFLGRLPRPGPWPAVGFALLVGVSLAFSLASLHDCFANRRAVAEAVRELRARGVPTDHIDAGFAWNGWFHAGPLRCERLLPQGEREIWYLARVFPDLKDDYVISVTPMPDRPILGRYLYRAWLPPLGSWREIWILGPRKMGGVHG